MSKILQPNQIHDYEFEFPVLVKEMNDIIEDLKVDEDDSIMYKSIIGSMDKMIFESAANDKCASIPYVGCVRINPTYISIRDNGKVFKEARKRMNKIEYKQFAIDTIKTYKDKEKAADKFKFRMQKIRFKNKAKYEELYKNLGKAYADMFLYSIYLFKEVPFDADWEYKYRELNG